IKRTIEISRRWGNFQSKIIGILEVEEARGDRMCQEALFELEMAVRAAGEHKQRINIVIAIDGIRLRDEKTEIAYITIQSIRYRLLHKMWPIPELSDIFSGRGIPGIGFSASKPIKLPA
ncbi:Dab2p, partial [Sarracenia purpurea var. burkii]